MTVKEMISEIEHLYGRQPHKYVMQLINDALLDIGTKKQHYTVDAKTIDVLGKKPRRKNGRYAKRKNHGN